MVERIDAGSSSEDDEYRSLDVALFFPERYSELLWWDKDDKDGEDNDDGTGASLRICKVMVLGTETSPYGILYRNGETRNKLAEHVEGL